jgi:hypothetical protein
LPTNIVFVDVNEKDDFGFLDIFYLSINLKKPIPQLIQNKN